MLWLSFVIVLLRFFFPLSSVWTSLPGKSECGRVAQQRHIHEFLWGMPKILSRIMIRRNYMVNVIKLSFKLLTYNVPSQTQHCICYFASLYQKATELEWTIITTRSSPDHVHGHYPWLLLMTPASLSHLSFILTHYYLHSLFSLLHLSSFSFSFFLTF